VEERIAVRTVGKDHKAREISRKAAKTQRFKTKGDLKSKEPTRRARNGETVGGEDVNGEPNSPSRTRTTTMDCGAPGLRGLPGCLFSDVGKGTFDQGDALHVRDGLFG
jgi:hypothetical protein